MAASRKDGTTEEVEAIKTGAAKLRQVGIPFTHETQWIGDQSPAALMMSR